MKTRFYTSIIVSSVLIMSLACILLKGKGVPTNIPADNNQIPTIEPISPIPPTSDLCKNKYMPIINDSTKVYVIKTTIAGTTVNSTNYETTFHFGDSDYFTVVTRLGSRVGYPVSGVWDCSDNGLTKSAFASGEFSNFFISSETGFSTLQTSDWCPGGITLPVNIQINDTWTQQTDFQFTSSNLKGWNWFKWNFLHQPLNAWTLPLPAGSGRFIYEYKAVRLEMIKIPAGTYDALRIDVVAKGYLDPSRDFSPSYNSSGCAWSSKTVD